MTLSKETLEEIAELARKATYKPCAMHITNLVARCDSEVVEELIRELLERRERDGQEITGWRALQNDNRDLREPLYLDGSNEPVGWNSDYAPVYSRTAPPAPVVPAITFNSASAFEDFWSKFEHPFAEDDELKSFASEIYRAAMLQGAEPISQPYTLRDGWVAVPVEPTEDMVIAGFEAELREEFRDPEAWEAFEAMSGCEQAAHRAKLCWAAMLAAAPKQESE